MIRSIYFPNEGSIKTDIAISELAQINAKSEGLLWVDFESTPSETDEPILRDVFQFHPLAIDDALQESHLPKLDDWDEYLYIVLHAVVMNQHNSDKLDTLEVDFFLGQNYFITHHDQKIQAIDQVWNICQKDERFKKNSSGYFLYRIADEIITNYMPVVELLDDQIDRAEDQVFENPTSETLSHIFTLKRAVLHLRRIIGPQREVLNKLARDEFRVIAKRERVYFRDIYDHLVRLYELTESIRDLVSGALDTYLSVINNRMNEIMKTLTIITTLFMPITFVTGFFGMNFFGPYFPFPRWTSYIAFSFVMLILVILPVVMVFWIRSKKWI